MLECEGFSTIGARNGAEAIAVLEQSNSPCVILVDLVMPVMGGWELLDILSRDQRWSRIPRLVLSALEPSLNIGATPSVRKPIEWRALISTVKEMSRTAVLAPSSNHERVLNA
jgi:CheY-like chemotaxis protein